MFFVFFFLLHTYELKSNDYIDVVVNRYHLRWITFAGDFTKSSTLRVQVQPLILDTTVSVQLIHNDHLRKPLMVCDPYQSGDNGKELARILHLIIKHSLYPDGS